MTIPQDWIETLRSHPHPTLPEDFASTVELRLQQRTKRRKTLRTMTSVSALVIAGALSLFWYRTQAPTPSQNDLARQLSPPATTPAPSPATSIDSTTPSHDEVRQRLQAIQNEIASLEAERDALELAQLRHFIRAQDHLYHDLSATMVSTESHLQTLGDN